MNLQQKSIEDITNSKQTPQPNPSKILANRKQRDSQSQIQKVNNESQFWNEQFSQIPSNFSKLNNSNYSVSFVQGQEVGRVGRVEIAKKKSSKKDPDYNQLDDSLDQHEVSVQQMLKNKNRLYDVEKSQSQISSKKQRKRQKKEKISNSNKGKETNSKPIQEKKRDLNGTEQAIQNGGLRKIKLKKCKNDNYSQELERAKNNSLQRYGELQNLGQPKKNVEPILRKQIQQIQSFINEEEFHQMAVNSNVNSRRKQHENEHQNNYFQSQKMIFENTKKYEKPLINQNPDFDIQIPSENLINNGKEAERQKSSDKINKNGLSLNNNPHSLSGGQKATEPLVFNYPKQLKSVKDNETLQRMWKYGIDKFVEAFSTVAKRSLKLEKLVYSVSKSMMVTSEAMAQNTKLLTQALNNFNNNQQNTASYWSSPNFEPLVRRRRTRGRKNLFSSYDVINYKTNYGNEPNDFQSIGQRIPISINERQKLGANLFQQNKNFDNPYPFSHHPFFGNTQMSDKQNMELQIDQSEKIGNLGYNQSSYMFDNQRFQEEKNQIKRNFGNDEKFKKKLQQVKEKAKLKQIETERKLHNFQKSSMKCSQSGFEDKSESAFPQEKQFDQILKQLAVEKQVEKIKSTIRNNNLHENQTQMEQQVRHNLKFEESMIGMMGESDSDREKQYNLRGRSFQVKKEEMSRTNQMNQEIRQQYEIKKTKNLQSNYLKKLQSIRKDGERRKRNHQVNQLNGQQFQFQKQREKEREKQKQSDQIQQKSQRDKQKDTITKNLQKNQKQKGNKKTINQSFAIRYKNVKYQFSPSDKYLQLAVVDRDTINSISDDNKQKIGTIIPQLDHEYNRHRITFQILHVQSWVAVGICDIDVVRKNRFFLRTKQFGMDGAYMVQSSGMCYSNSQIQDHRKLKGFKFGTGDVVRIILDSNNKIITFIKGKGDLMQKFSMKYDSDLELSKIRFCVGLSRTKDLVSVQNLKIKEHE